MLLDTLINSGCCVAGKRVMKKRHMLLPNVPDDLSLLASGMTPAREAESAGGMTEVPKA